MSAELLQAIVNERRPINITLNLSDLKEVIRTILTEERKRMEDAIKNEHLKPTLTRKEAACALGVSVSTLHRLCTEHQITAYKVGNAVRFKQADIDSYLATNKKISY